MTPEEINKCRIKSMEMRTDDENRRIVTGLTFRMKMKPKEEAEDYLYGLFDDELIAERMRLKAMKKRVNENLEENKKFRRDKYIPNKKIQHASTFSGSVNFLCGRLGIDASASRRVAQIYITGWYIPSLYF